MKVKCTKVFAAWINKAAKDHGAKFSARLVLVPGSRYEFTTGDSLFHALDFGDWDIETGNARCIAIEYPFEFFACTKYLTTRQLSREFRARGVKDVSGLEKMILEMCEV